MNEYVANYLEKDIEGYYKKCNGYSKAVERLKNGRHGNLTKCRKTGV